MGRQRLKVILVGLPLFAKRLESELNVFSPQIKSTALDTYYNKWDKVKAIFLIPFCDVVYSINGTLDKSRIVDWALFWKKKVMLTWVGTDVVKASKLDRLNQKYLNDCQHFCEVTWIKNELGDLGVDAKILNFFNFNSDSDFTWPDGKELVILSYVSQGREEFYGWSKILDLAKAFPEVSFRIVGTNGNGLSFPENIDCLGWVQDMDVEFKKAHATLRLLQHDGLSGFVLESLLRGKYVLYSEPLDHCLHVVSKTDAFPVIQDLKDKLEKGELLSNSNGRSFVLKEFNKEKILSELIQEMQKK